MNLFRRWVGASFAGEGAAGGGRLGRGGVSGSLVAPPWFKPCADAWVGSEVAAREQGVTLHLVR